jgi:ubiquinone biosynthesis protein COQ9
MRLKCGITAKDCDYIITYCGDTTTDDKFNWKKFLEQLKLKY